MSNHTPLSTYEGKNVLVTGGLGMIGSHAATQLADLGANVVVLDVLLNDHGGNLHNIVGYDNKITVVNGDIRDRSVLDDLVPNQDVIIHCAAHVSYPDSMKDPLFDLDINCRGHLNLLEACRYLNRDVKIVFTSSRMKYGALMATPVPETHSTEPLMIYGAHKLVAEKYHHIYHANYGIRYANIVVANPYGPRQQMKHAKYGLLNWFIRMAMEEKPITIYGEGDQIRDYIYVEDIVRGILLAGISENVDAGTFNLGSGTGTRFVDMVKQIVEIVGSGSYVHIEWPESYFNIETGDFIADITKAKQLLGFTPETSLRAGITNTYEFYKSQHKYYW